MIPAAMSSVWVSVEARNIWSERFNQLGRAIVHSTLLGVHEGKWPKRSLHLYGGAWLNFLSESKKYHIRYQADVLNKETSASRAGHRVEIMHPDFHTLDTTLTACKDCQAVAAQNRSPWEMARQSPGARLLAEHIIEHNSTLLSILFWEHMGLSLFAEQPCSLECSYHLNLIESQLDWMESINLQEEAAQLREVLSWPLEWSSLHGIQELKWPVQKLMIANNLHVYPGKHLIRILGNSYPEQGAHGLDFPYRTRDFKLVSDSKSFKKGIDHNTIHEQS